MQPHFPGNVVTPTFDRLVKDVSELSGQARNLLAKTIAQLSHQVGVTLLPEFTAVVQRAAHPETVRLDGMFGNRLRIEWRQITMPIDDFRFGFA